jgi:tRNA threonylcarbamoyladenosine biosynthesis protein TsaE
MSFLSSSPRTLHSLSDTSLFAEDFMRFLFEREKNRATATIIALSGDLGVGKTTFTQIMGNLLGVSENITSPTFVLQRIYKLKENSFWDYFIHIDAYRLEGGKDMEALQWEKYATDQRNIIFIEWPTKVRDALPYRSFWIEMKEGDTDESRIFTFS